MKTQSTTPPTGENPGQFNEITLENAGWYFFYPTKPDAFGKPCYVNLEKDTIDDGDLQCPKYAGTYLGPLTPPALPGKIKSRRGKLRPLPESDSAEQLLRAALRAEHRYAEGHLDHLKVMQKIRKLNPDEMSNGRRLAGIKRRLEEVFAKVEALPPGHP